MIPDAGDVPSAAWSPNGSRLIAGGKIWDANKGTLLAALSRTDLEELSWSPDGSRLVAPDPNGTAVVLDAASGVEVLALKSPAAAVLSATWSPDGSRIRAVCSDGTIRIWDARPVNPESIPEDMSLPRGWSGRSEAAASQRKHFLKSQCQQLLSKLDKGKLRQFAIYKYSQCCGGLKSWLI